MGKNLPLAPLLLSGKVIQKYISRAVIVKEFMARRNTIPGEV
jgi:hypothetical protein